LDLPAGKTAIKVTKSGYHAINFNIVLIDKMTMNIGVLELPLIEASLDPSVAIMTGKIVDAQTLQRPQGLIINVVPSGSETIEIQSDGSFTVSGIVPGDYQFIFSAPAYLPKQSDFKAAAGEVLDAGIVALNLAPTTALISGVISDAHTGLGLGSATVTITNNTVSDSVLTNAVGEYSLVIAPGSANIEVSLNGYLSLAASADLAAGAQLQFSPSLTPDEGEPNVDPIGARLIGSVIDSTTGKGLESASLSLANEGKTIITDGNGQFDVSELLAGETVLSLTKEGYIAASFNLILIDKTTVNVGALKLELVPEKNLAVMNGRILNFDSGLGIAGANVVVDGHSTTSAADGSYEIVGFANTEFLIQASASGYASSSKQISLTHMASLTIDLDLRRTSISGIQISTVVTDKNSYQAYE
jgi:hypothetical protein